MRKIGVIGFSSFEFGAFEAFFKMVAVSRPNGFIVTNQTDGVQIVFVNGTHRSAVALAETLPSRPQIVIVGADAFGTRHTLLPRPIRLTSALALANQLAPAPSVAAQPAASPQALPGQTNSQPRLSPLSRPLPSSPEVRPSVSVSAGLRNAYVQASPPAPQMPPISQSSARTVSPPTSDFTAGSGDDDSEILVVDDSDVALRFMQDHLGAFGFGVHLATSGEECLMLLNQRKFRCVFLDVMMSGIDGYQTCRMIKQRKYQGGAAPTVIMMTSRSGAIDRVRGALAGCDGYLVKPVDEGKLIKALFQHRVSNSPMTSSRLQSRLSTLTR